MLEDDPISTPGAARCSRIEGGIELDAAIMDGRDRAAGAVAGVTRHSNPFGLARAVMEHSPHVFLAGEGAEQFAREQGSSRSSPAGSRPERRRSSRNSARRRRAVRRRPEVRHGRRGRPRRRPGRGGDLDRRPDRQALGPDRRFAGDRRRDLRRRPRLRRLGHRSRRIFHPRRCRPCHRDRVRSATRGSSRRPTRRWPSRRLGGDGGVIVGRTSGKACSASTRPECIAAWPPGRPHGRPLWRRKRMIRRLILVLLHRARALARSSPGGNMAMRRWRRSPG